MEMGVGGDRGQHGNFYIGNTNSNSSQIYAAFQIIIKKNLNSFFFFPHHVFGHCGDSDLMHF